MRPRSLLISALLSVGVGAMMVALAARITGSPCGSHPSARIAARADGVPGGSSDHDVPLSPSTETPASELLARIASLEASLEACEAARAAWSMEVGADALQAHGPNPDAFESSFEWLVSRRGFDADATPWVRQLAEDARDLGPEGANMLRERLRSLDPTTRAVACMVAEKLDDPALCGDLSGIALVDPVDPVRVSAARAIATIADRQSLDALELVLKQSNEFSVRMEVWAGLARLREPSAMTEFERLLNEAPDSMAANELVQAALRSGDDSVQPALSLAAADPRMTPNLRKRIVNVLEAARAQER